VIITCNYEHLIEPFIKSRFDKVLVDLPTYSARLVIANIFVKKYAKRAFPANPEAKEDFLKPLNPHDEEDDWKNQLQQDVIALFDHEFKK
jgi:hypothetical protein